MYVLDKTESRKCHFGKEDERWIWNRRMGHIHFDNLVSIYKNKSVQNMPKVTNPANSICEQCQHGKQTRVHFKTKEHYSTKPLELIHADLCEPTKRKWMNGEKYFMLLIDDYTYMAWVCLLNRKSEAFGCFKIFKELVKNEIGSRIKCLRSENGGEFTSNEFNKYYEKHGIKRQYSIARTP